MERRVPFRGHVADLEEMVQVGAGQPRRTERAVTPVLERRVLDAVLRVVDAQRREERIAGRRAPGRPAWTEGIQPSLSRIAGRQRAIEDRIAQGKGAHHVVRPAEPQGVLRRLGRQGTSHPAEGIGQQRAVLGQREAAEAVAIEADRRQRRGALPPQALGSSALHHREEQRPLCLRHPRHATIELVPAALRPPHRPFDAALLLTLGILRRGAVVEADEDIGP